MPLLTVKTRSPLSLRFSGPESCVAATFASHTRRRATRVMVVVMVPIQHESTTLPEAIPTVKPEIAIVNISFLDEFASLMPAP